ncbi:DNA alkylation repair protein [Candidatus Daviesbacteria bacterium]|nr:DNA alkylation repair protein [Candidatus Daviesbacteria bacterium]
MLNKFHQEISDQIKSNSRPSKNLYQGDSYVSSGHEYYYVSVPKFREIAKNWAVQNKDISISALLEVLDSIIKGKSYEEKIMAGIILDYLPKQRSQLDPQFYNKWLDYLVGWAEIDSLCQSAFSSKEILSKWNQWEKLIIDFSQDQNISKRRASLVLLTSPVGQSDNQRLADLSFQIIDKLKSEKDILITKAISWLLRSLIKNHKNRLQEYLKQNMNSLPKIAIRETKNKLLKGKK